MLNIDYLKLLRHLKSSAKRRNIEFNLTEYDLLTLSWPITCPILGMPLEYNFRGYNENKPSVDRIDNDLGYVSGNVQIISCLANRSKNSLTDEELKKFALFYQI